MSGASLVEYLAGSEYLINTIQSTEENNGLQWGALRTLGINAMNKKFVLVGGRNGEKNT